MEIKLGFGAIPKPQYVFVSKESDHCWYMLEEGRPLPVYDRALTGVITGIEINKKVETSHGEAIKTDLHVLAEKPYVVRSGSESYFSKSLLLSLDAILPEQLFQPLSITVTPGDKTIVFCAIYSPLTYRPFEIAWDGHRDLDWHSIGERVILKINAIRHSRQPLQPSIADQQDIDDLIAQSERYLNQLKWTSEQGRQYLLKRYGKRSRLLLSPTELQEFIMYLQALIATVP